MSALGEPLRAEIEILDINADEAASLKSSVAQPETFRNAGLEYSASAIAGMQITLKKRADGRSYLQVSNARAINDPYVDLILEVSWATGRIVRDYTMLFDPPNLKQPQAAAAPVVAPQVSSVPVRVIAEPAPSTQPAQAAETAKPAEPAQAAQTAEPTQAAEPSQTTEAGQPAQAAEPAQPAQPAEQVPAATSPLQETVTQAPGAVETPVSGATEAKQPEPATPPVQAEAAAPAAAPAPTAPPIAVVAKRVTVKTGDTASKIVAGQKPSWISLDQMLVALQRANPGAFTGGNINRIRSGTVLNLPSAEEAQFTSATDARQIVITQSKEFNEFRRKLASSAPASQVTTADRKDSGTVQATVEVKKSPVAAPDKLTLSKGAVQGKAPEEKIAKEREAKEAAIRAEEVSKNIADLNKLSKESAPAVVPAASAAKAPTPAPVAAAAPAASAAKPAAAPTVAAAASAPAPVSSAPVAVAATPKPAASAPVKRPSAPAATPVAEPDLIDELLDNPLVPAAAGGLVALLAGFAFYRIRQRKNAAMVDSAYLESRLQPDSFFGASGGQRVDTNDQNASGSSMVYSPSQLDSADDVDPVAEADVYLAYGRDLQAEEILKEALRTHPSRVAIHMKLLEIYAKRRDLKSFEGVAKTAFKLTDNAGPEWTRVCELGRSIDPSNALYQPGGKPPASAPAPLQEMDTGSGFASTQTRPVATPPAPASTVDLDLDLDFSLDEPAPSAISEPASSGRQSGPAPLSKPSARMEFDEPLPELAPQLNELPASSSPAQAPSAKAGMMEFDLGSLSLDLGATSEQTSTGSEDPLGTKLALAEEFSAIGDTDGARALIEEIIAEASGEMKAKAQKALSQLA
jgi:pilus assembly protein FimV